MIFLHVWLNIIKILGVFVVAGFLLVAPVMTFFSALTSGKDSWQHLLVLGIISFLLVTLGATLEYFGFSLL